MEFGGGGGGGRVQEEEDIFMRGCLLSCFSHV